MSQIAPHIRGARREDYEPNVLAFVPSAQGEELEIRSALLLMRDLCMAAKAHASDQGWVLYGLVEQTVSLQAFAAMPIERLRELRLVCRRCIATAAGFDDLFALPVGGTDAGGK